MDAKTRANFINSVASGNVIPCPNCGAANKSDSKFCIQCGTKLGAPAPAQTDSPKPAAAPAFAPVAEASVPQNVAPAASVDIPAQNAQVRYVEEKSVFAEGLPEWDIVPPQVVVRRHA
ncbi:MAG: zinc-ribbon domain-containing protein [Oscillospiraceae bacterium]|nr:zinc-ribbon domain-containing protein [Oscillospiraceae bacterium]